LELSCPLKGVFFEMQLVFLMLAGMDEVEEQYFGLIAAAGSA
jgi:hypothetical protein